MSARSSAAPGAMVLEVPGSAPPAVMLRSEHRFTQLTERGLLDGAITVETVTTANATQARGYAPRPARPGYRSPTGPASRSRAGRRSAPAELFEHTATGIRIWVSAVRERRTVRKRRPIS